MKCPCCLNKKKLKKKSLQLMLKKKKKILCSYQMWGIYHCLSYYACKLQRDAPNLIPIKFMGTIELNKAGHSMFDYHILGENQP